MNQLLKQAIAEVELLPEHEQDELARTLLDLAWRKRVDAELAVSEAEGGEIPHEEFMAELTTEYGR